MTCFFIISCARSGSTSLAAILNKAENVRCVIEPEPNLNYETREMMEGRIENPYAVVENSVVQRVKAAFHQSEIYGEKSVTYGPFIPFIFDLLRPKFIFIKRDGRDVVRSLVDWHDNAFGGIYRECKNPGNLNQRALAAVSKLPIHKDTSDYSRPRPLHGDPLYDRWEGLTRWEMCTFYWTRINEIHLRGLQEIPRSSWMEIDYTNPTNDDIVKVLDFIGATGLSSTEIDALLSKKINSLTDRFGKPNTNPDWRYWDGLQRRQFKRIAQDTMMKLGYTTHPESFWKPKDYGVFWMDRPDIEGWFKWMWGSRSYIHTHLINWVKTQKITSMADFGCGIGEGYAEAFKDLTYIGVDISPMNIAWCNENRKNPNHAYLVQDCITTPLPHRPDLVFSSGTIDNAYDIDQFLKAMVRDASKWIYATGYRGWYPELEEHKYRWNPEHGCFYNDLSPLQIEATLKDVGCSEITVKPIPKNNEGTEFETLIIAKTSGSRQ